MDDHFYCCRVWYDAKAARSRMKFLTMSGGWTNRLEDAQSFASRDSARLRLRKRSASILTGAEIKASNYL